MCEAPSDATNIMRNLLRFHGPPFLIFTPAAEAGRHRALWAGVCSDRHCFAG